MVRSLWSLRSVLLVVTICLASFLFAGYDLAIFGAAVPFILRTHDWKLSSAALGSLGSLVSVGMLVGSLGVGFFADTIGRKKTLIICVCIFSSFIGLCGLAPSPGLFGLFYAAAGIGIGGVIPTAATLTIEYALPRRQTFTYTIMFTGYPLGGMLASLLSISLMPAVGWRSLFLLGSLPFLVLVVPAILLLPESITFLLTKGRTLEADALAQRFALSLPKLAEQPATTARQGSPISLRSTVVFGCVAFFIMYMVFAITAWLPQIMIRDGYSMVSSLSFLLALNAGCVVSTIPGHLADRYGTKTICVLVLLLGAIATIALSMKAPLIVIYLLLIVIYLLLIVIRNGTLDALNLFNAYIAQNYPVAVARTATGRVTAIGRLGGILGPVVGGFLQSATFNQALAAELVQGDFLPRHIQTIRRVYHERRDVMLAAMQEHFPDGVSWTRPERGMFLWVTMSEGVDTEALLGEAIANKVAFVPGTSFFPLSARKNTMRLNFSNARPEQIREGIARLGSIFQRADFFRSDALNSVSLH